MVEYSDIKCPYCGKSLYAEELDSSVKSKHKKGSKVYCVCFNCQHRFTVTNGKVEKYDEEI